LEVGDFDVDGHLDVAVANQGSQSVSVFPGNGDGTFDPGILYWRGSAPTAAAVTDLDGDGTADIAVAVQGSANNSVSVLRNTACERCMEHCDECTDPSTCTTCSAGYVFDPDAAACVPDRCIGVVCDAQDACHVAGTCDPLTGTCSTPAAADGTACDDGNACTQADTCDDGECKGGDYAWSDLLQPINVDGSSIFKLGSTIPVKFQLVGACSGLVGLDAHLFLAKLTNSILGTEVEATGTSAADVGNTFRYAGNDQYIFNLSTKELSKGTWLLRIDLGDGVSNRTVTISLK